MDAINEAIKNNTNVRALVMLEDRLDVLALDRQLYARKVSLQERAYTVITALQQKAANTQGPILSYLASTAPGDVVSYKSMWAVNMIVVEATPSVIMELSERNEIGYLHIDGQSKIDEPLNPMLSESSPNGSEPGLLAVKADLMWAAGFTGAGSIVMNLDTGVNLNHPALSYKWRGNSVPASQAWFDPINGSPVPFDRDNSVNHGTHTMGTMTGLDPVTNDTVGVAPGAEWIAASGASGTSFNIAGFQWAMDPDGNPATSDDMPTVINCSIYDPAITTQCNAALNPYIDVLSALEAAGVAVVWSAGNSGPGTSTVTPPKNVNIDEVHFWATGALNGNNPGYPIAGFSSRGPVISECTTGIPSLDIKPEASAPGVNVRSSQFNSYGFLDGTSMAAPHVSGAIALLKEAHPNRTGHELKMALYLTAVDLGTPGEDNTYGMGIIDVWAAHESLADPDDPNPPTDVAAYSDFTTPTSMALSWTDPTTLVSGTPIAPSDFTIEIDRDGLNIASVPGGNGNYTDTGLNDGTLYTYDVYAKLITNDSTSSLVTVSRHAGGHPVPAAPANLAVTATATDAVLTWNDPATQEDGTPLDDLDHINVYRDGVKIASVSPGTQTYPDTPPPGFFYTYTVTAVDNETPPNESAASNEAGGFIGTTPNFLVWVGPDIPPGNVNALSGDSIFAALVANGESAFLTNNLFEFGNDLSIYEGVFVVLGIYSNNHVIDAADPEGPALEAAIQGGTHVYVEGGDCFNYDPETGGHQIRPWFSLNDGPDGSSDLNGIVGLNDLSAFSFPYVGENNYMDELQPDNSLPVWQNNANNDISGVFHTGWPGRTIGVVPSFGGLVDNSAPVNPERRVVLQVPQKRKEVYNDDVKPRPQNQIRQPFVKKAAYHPELRKNKPVNELFKVTPKGIELLANTKEDLMAAYLAFWQQSVGNPVIQLSATAFSDTLLVGGTTTDVLTVSNVG
jgi:subtilisin family serine protease